MSKSTYKTLVRLESRGKDGRKSVIKANTILELTDAQAKEFGDNIRKVKPEFIASEESDPDGGDGGDGGKDAGGSGAKGGSGAPGPQE